MEKTIAQSPYLTAVQALNGDYAGAKYRDLHLIAKTIKDDEKECAEFVKTGISERVQPALLPYLRIVFGSKFQIGEFVVEALKSDDVTIVKQALGARWFFSGSSPLIEVKYFVKEVVPQVSVRTRVSLIKTLALCLVEDPRKAEYFFDKLSDRYGAEHTLPLLTACGEKYIFDMVLRRRIVLPKRILTILYRRYPNLVIRYLRLGNSRCSESEADRKLHRIDLSNYVNFLPLLVKQHTDVFIELYDSLAFIYQKSKLGSTRAEYFLKNAMKTLIKKPRTYLDMLPLKLVSNKLTAQQFDTMFENLLFLKSPIFRLSDVVKHLQYYPQEKKLDLLLSSYSNRFGKNLLDDPDTIFSVKEFYKLLPNEVKEELARRYVERYEGMPSYYEKLYFLPPSESLPKLKEKISTTLDADVRSRYIEYMIISCSLYNSKEDLLQVLEYYNKRHKNEQAFVLQQVLGSLVQRFDIAKLDKAHWQVLKEMIQWSYVKGFLNDAPVITYVPLFSGALRYYIKRQETNNAEDKKFLDNLVRIITDLFFEKNMKWDFINELQDLGRDWLCKFLEIIPDMYKEDNTAWNKSDNKMFIATYLIRAMECLNAKGEVPKRKHKKASATTSDSQEGSSRPPRFTIRDYPWLKKLVHDLLKLRNKKSTRLRRFNMRRFAKILRQHDAEFYQCLIDEDEELTNDVQSEDALLLLKRDHKKILSKWKQYLDVCRYAVQFSKRSVQRFVIATKWYEQLPVLFVEQCVKDVEVEGNVLILGLLLEGEELAKLIKPYIPQESEMDIGSPSAKRTYEFQTAIPKAMIMANPPVSFDVLALFCKGHYITLSLQSLTSVGQRIPVDKVRAFVTQDFSRKPVVVKKLGIRLFFLVATGNESRDVLQKLWSEERNHSVREVLAKMILDLFKKSPSADNWALLKICIEGLTAEDRSVFTLLEQLNQIDTCYIALYLQEFIKKLDSFTNEQFEEDSRLGHLRIAVNYIDKELMQHLPDELAENILKRCLLRYPASFIVDVFLFSDRNKFEYRLKTFIKILLEELKQFNVPDACAPRCCSKNREVREFFGEIVLHVYKNNQLNKTSLHLRLVKAMLLLFKSSPVQPLESPLQLFESPSTYPFVLTPIYPFQSSPLHPWEEPRSYIDLCLCKDYLEVQTPTAFGQRCVAIAKNLVKLCSSELVLAQFSEVLLTKVLQNDCVYRPCERVACKLTIIGSMMSEDPRLGALIGIKLLSHYEAGGYDAKYDEFMKTWKAMDDPMVQTLLSEFVNTSNRLYYSTDNASSMRFINLH